jgi:tripartite-type tricarboxylate transporter receptor subunit TctC
MSLPRLVSRVSAVAILAIGTASAQPYPNKTIRIVTLAAGTGADFVARLVAQGIAGPMGQQVIVDNRPSGVIPGEIVSRAVPDGYTLLVVGGALWIGPLLQTTPYDVVRDFSPITVSNKDPAIVVVHPSLPVKSVKELIALAKARPGELNWASSSSGSSGHLAGELFKSMADINIVRIAYKGTSFSLIALIAGEVQLQFSSPLPLAGHIKSGRLRALAVTSAEPSPLAPGMPTVAASGLPGYEAIGLTAVFAPAKTPTAIIQRLNQEIVQVLGRADTKEKLFNAGSEVVGSSPEQAAAIVKSDLARWGKVIKDAGIKAD